MTTTFNYALQEPPCRFGGATEVSHHAEPLAYKSGRWLDKMLVKRDRVAAQFNQLQ